MKEFDLEEPNALELQFEAKLKEATKPYKGMPLGLSGGIDSSVLAAFIEPGFAISVELPGDDKHNEVVWARVVASHLNIPLEVVKLDHLDFETSVEKAVKAIGRPIPHFNVFPLYKMYERLAGNGVKDFVVGDGPDETMCGYARDLIVAHVYGLYEMDAFKHYKPLLDKMLKDPIEAISLATNKSQEEIRALGFTKPIDIVTAVDIELMRDDMDQMSNKIAESFGITNHRPYQDNVELDKYMRELPLKAKIQEVEYGKYLLRKVASRRLPPGIAWRKGKVGGPVYPVNRMMGWDKTDGEFGKNTWMKYQEGLLKR